MFYSLQKLIEDYPSEYNEFVSLVNDDANFNYHPSEFKEWLFDYALMTQ